MEQIQIEKIQNVLNRMKVDFGTQYPLWDILEESGFSDIDIDYLIACLVDLGVVKKTTGKNRGEEYELTTLGRDKSLKEIFKTKEATVNAEVLANKKIAFDWRHRWWSHPLVTAALGFIFGFLLACISARS